MTEKEWNYLIRYAQSHEGNSVVDLEVRMVRVLWSAYCLHANLDPETKNYDKDMDALWESVKDNWMDDGYPYWGTYEDFYNDMTEYLAY